MKYILTAVLLAFCYTASSQKKMEFVDVNKIVNELSKAVDNKTYDKLFQGISEIPKNDSLYCGILISKSYYLMQEKRYEESLKVYDEAIEQACDKELLPLKINQAVLYLRTEDFEKSLMVSEEILKSRPYNKSALYNRALALERLKRYEESYLAFQQLIKMNPLEADVHLQLGLLCYKRGLTAQALLALNTWMLLSDDLDTKANQLDALNRMSFTPYTEDPVTFSLTEEEKSFSTIDKILDQGLALQKSYKTGNDIDVQLVKQNHILFTYLKDHKLSNGVWSSIYIPLYKKVMDDEKFNEFSYYITQVLKETKLKSSYKKNENDALKAARELVAFYLMTTAKSDLENEYHYENGLLQAVGKTINDKPIGDYVFIDNTGTIITSGSFDTNNEKDGVWKTYYKDGQVAESFTYTNGKKNGVNVGYYPNGQKKFELNFINDEAVGIYQKYTESGALKIKKQLKNSVNDGAYLGYFDLGEDVIEYEGFYKNDKLEGVLKEYYSNGALFQETMYKDHQKNGFEKTYNIDGLMVSEVNYQSDEITGENKKFHNNGNRSEISTAKNGYYSGDFTTYHENGQVAIKSFYNESGELNGLYSEYADDGKVWYQYEYVKGKLNSFTYFDKNGEILSQGKKKAGKLDFKAYSKNGLLFIEGTYDSRDGKIGEWKYYNAESGYLSYKGSYDDNQAIGTHISYYPNGSQKDVNSYVMGLVEDYGASYYPDGKIKAQGFYKKGEKHGTWEDYYADGTLESRAYFDKGIVTKWEENYDVTGRLFSKDLYVEGELKKEVYFKTDGAQQYAITYPIGTETTMRKNYNQKGGLSNEFELKHGILNGSYVGYSDANKVVAKGSYLNNDRHGTFEWFYTNGQVESVKNYKLGRSHGVFKGFYENGSLEYQLEYLNNERHGPFVSYFENGEIDTKSNYIHDKLHGERKQFDHLGNLQFLRFYDHGAFIGYSYLDKNGNLVNMIPVEKETAFVKAFYKDGKVSREYELKNGEIQGTYKVYFVDGKPQATTEYVNGLIQGNEIAYYPNGNVKLKSVYLKDFKHGMEVAYYENGKKKSEMQYVNGKKHGDYKTYNNNGELISTQEYINDVLQF